MLTVEMWPVARLIPYARNPRRNDAAVGKMCSAIREFGFRIPVVARSDGTVVDGHLRLKAAQQLGLDEVPVALADDLSEAQIKAFRLLANRSAAWAEWDDELLTLELQDLQALGYDLGLTGFDAAELRSLLDDGPATGLTDEDAVPGTPAEPLTRPGDLILLGPHRLLCGDATRADDVARLLDGARPHLMVTDPPYGVDYDPSWRNEAGVSATRRTGKVANDDRADWRRGMGAVPRRRRLCLARGGPRHHGRRQPDRLRLRASGRRSSGRRTALRSAVATIIGSTSPAGTRCARAPAATGRVRETSRRCGRSRHRGGGCGDRRTARRSRSRRCAGRSSTTAPAATPSTSRSADRARRLIAAETVGRVCLAMELEPAYCDVIVERWEAFTGRSATRLAS